MIYTIWLFCSARDKIKETLKAFLPKAKQLHETVSRKAQHKIQRTHTVFTKPEEMLKIMWRIVSPIFICKVDPWNENYLHLHSFFHVEEWEVIWNLLFIFEC